MNAGSIGEMPPSTRGSRGFSARTASAASSHHRGEDLPVGIELEVPVRQVVRLVPEHHRFDHRCGYTARGSASSASIASADEHFLLGMRRRSRNPALRSIASAQARFGIHQFVGSSGVAVLDEVHPRIAGLVEDRGLAERIVRRRAARRRRLPRSIDWKTQQVARRRARAADRAPAADGAGGRARP